MIDIRLVFAVVTGLVCLFALLTGWRPWDVSVDALFIGLVLCVLAVPLSLRVRE